MEETSWFFTLLIDLRTTILILVEGALDARGFKLVPTNKDFGYSFSCDDSE